jgi:hypothetical protein
MIRVQLDPNTVVKAAVLDKIAGGWSVTVKIISESPSRKLSTQNFKDIKDAYAYQDAILKGWR